MHVWRKRPLILCLNLLVYGLLVAMMGSCAQFSHLKSLDRASLDSKATLLFLQYEIQGHQGGAHTLYLRDSAGDLVELSVAASQDPRQGVVFEIAGGRSYQLEAIDLGQGSYLLSKLTKAFLVREKKHNYLGAMRFELRDGDMIFSFQSPMESTEAIARLEKQWGLQAKQLVNPYTGKNFALAKTPSRVELKHGRVEGSFKDYIEAINPCYIEEWKKNPVVLGQLDFMVAESNGVLRVAHLNSQHTASEDFEQCVWNKVADTRISDRSFQIKLPGILYF